MVTMVLGENASGKTLYIKKKCKELASKYKMDVVTNLIKVPYDGIDEKRYQLLSDEEAYEYIWDCREIDKSTGVITIEGGSVFSEYFLNIVTLLCRKGDYLILDEPEFDLLSREINMLYKICELILPTYKEVHIATHQQWLFGLADRWLWVQDYKVKEISEEEVYAHIGTL